MTERLYYSDPALIDFMATITRVSPEGDRWAVLLDRTAFYPTSGGQQADRGTIAGVPVLDVSEDDSGAVVHILVAVPGEPGMKVHGLVDAARRLRHRQQHTAQHILSQVFVRLFEGETVSVHLGEEYGAIELAGPAPSAAHLAAAEAEAGRIVAANHPVAIRFVTREEAAQLPLRKIPERDGQMRLIQIGEFDYSACGGTHCLSTAEVGLIKITGATRQRGNTLVTFLAGMQAVEDYRVRFDVTERMATDLTCHFRDIPGRVGKLSDELKLVRLELNAARRDLLPAQAEQLAQSAEVIGRLSLVVAPLPEGDAKLAGLLLAAIVERTKGVAAGTVEQRLLLAVHPATGLKAGDLAREMCATSGLKGGGGPVAAQIGGVEAGRVDELLGILQGLIGNA